MWTLLRNPEQGACASESVRHVPVGQTISADNIGNLHEDTLESGLAEAGISSLVDVEDVRIEQGLLQRHVRTKQDGCPMARGRFVDCDA